MYINTKTGFFYTGNIGEPEFKQVGNKNTPLLTFGMPIKKSDDVTEWVNAQLWGEMAVAYKPLLRKGDKVIVCAGSVKTNTHNGKNYYQVDVDAVIKVELSLPVKDVSQPSSNDFFEAKIDDVDGDLPF